MLCFPEFSQPTSTSDSNNISQGYFWSMSTRVLFFSISSKDILFNLYHLLIQIFYFFFSSSIFIFKSFIFSFKSLSYLLSFFLSILHLLLLIWVCINLSTNKVHVDSTLGLSSTLLLVTNLVHLPTS